MPNERRKNARLSAKEANRVLSILEGLPTLRASPHFPHEWPSPPGPPSLPYDLEPSAPSDPPHSMMFSEPPPPSNPPDPVFALLSLPSFISRVRPPTRSSFFPTVCRISHGVLSARACLASGASLIRHCHTPNFVVDHPRARHSALRSHIARRVLRFAPRTLSTRYISSPTSMLVIFASSPSATSNMLLSAPLSVVAFVPSPPPSFSLVLCCPSGRIA